MTYRQKIRKAKAVFIGALAKHDIVNVMISKREALLLEPNINDDGFKADLDDNNELWISNAD
jgi:hypothetical protein